MLMAALRSAKHQQLMFPLKNSVSKVKRCNISFTNLLFIKQLKFTFLYNITWLLNHTQLTTDLAFWNLLFLHGAECKSRLNLVRGNYLCHQPLKCHKWWRHNFSLQYKYNIKQTSDENKEKYQLEYYQLIQQQILQTNITRTVRQTVRRITNKCWKMQLFGKFLVGLLFLLLTPYVSLVRGVFSSTKSLFFCNSSSRSEPREITSGYLYF